MKIDGERAKVFVASVPGGRWTSYGDVAQAGGTPKGAMAVGGWLMARGDEIPGVHRVLNAKGEVSAGWVAATPALPQTPDAVRALLREEGVRLNVAGRASRPQRWTTADWAAEDRSVR